ncbi:MAG: PTS glucose transporter subunit IIA [Clostridia bacterium]|nr:PTS glucose transporter subunit IIA [Clostridia bacterium]
MLKKLFKKSGTEFSPPMAGKVVSLDQVPDAVFSKKMVGDGFAVIPSEGKVYAPVNGKVVQLFPTKHAIAIIDESGLEMLIHVGIDTVELKGEGFVAHIEKGSEIKKGQLLLEVDLEFVQAQDKAIITPVVFTNQKQYQSIEVVSGNLTIADTACIIRK